MTTTDPTRCPFCDIIAGRAPGEVRREWPDAIALTPLNPVTPGHTLIIPKAHTPSFGADPTVSATAMRRAAEYAGGVTPANVITSQGREATQSVLHLHLHIIPRFEGDGMALPWHSGKRSRKDAQR